MSISASSTSSRGLPSLLENNGAGTSLAQYPRQVCHPIFLPCFKDLIFCSVHGFAFPALGIVFARGIEGLSKPTDEERRHEGNRTALWLFVVAIVAGLSIAGQNYFFSTAAYALTAGLRSLGFKALLRQDSGYPVNLFDNLPSDLRVIVEYFDKDENTSGGLTAKLSENPERVNGLAGMTLGAIVQAISTVILGSILGLVFIWKVGLVGIAATPLIVSPGYFRLVCDPKILISNLHIDQPFLACHCHERSTEPRSS